MDDAGPSDEMMMSAQSNMEAISAAPMMPPSDEDDPGHDALIKALNKNPQGPEKNISAAKKSGDANRERSKENREDGKDHSEAHAGRRSANSGSISAGARRICLRTCAGCRVENRAAIKPPKEEPIKVQLDASPRIG